MKPGQSPQFPLVSVVLSTFNRARLLPRAIRSVLRQTFPRWELIVVDDGSTDDTEHVVRRFLHADTRIRYVRHTNRGLPRSRNRGISLARGKYVTFLDSDDEYLPGHLATRVALMERRPDVALLYGGTVYRGPRRKQYVLDATRPGKKIHLSRCFASGTFFAQRKILVRMKGFRALPYAEDFDLIQRMERKGLLILKVPSRTYVYHVDAADRLCELFERGGERKIVEFRRAGRKGGEHIKGRVNT